MIRLEILCIMWISFAFTPTYTLKDERFSEIKRMDVFDEEAMKNVASKVHFYLYTREYDYDYELVLNDLYSLTNSTFDPSKPIKIAIHGYEHDYTNQPCQLIKEAYINSSQDVNVFCVDWGQLCRGPPHGLYLGAVLNVPKVAKLLAQLIDFLVKSGSADVTSFHLIGHSLGAHLAAFAANDITSGNISRITGMDPALPLYNLLPSSWRLDPSDAGVVDVIHSAGGFYGLYNPQGSVDFYPNGGRPVQPGCVTDIPWLFQVSCSHLRAVQYYASSVLNSFPAKGCSSLKDVKKGDCDGAEAFMGDLANTAPDGIYFLQTSDSWPYTLM